MKTLKQIKEEYDNITLSQMPEAPEDLVLEGREAAVNKSSKIIPSFSQMPAMLLFRRVAYRLYPNKQVVALYYSKTVDKYLSVPFGPDGNLNLSESSVYNTEEQMELEEGAKWEATKGAVKGALHGTIRGGAIGGAIAPGPGTAIGAVVGGVRGAYKGAKRGYEKGKNMEEDWQSVNRKDKTDGLSQKAVDAYRRENPGSKLKTAVTEKNPKGKRASRRKSFCSRMGGMKKRLTSAKTARDPDSRINKALRRWNCEEDFKLKLAQLREGRVDESPLDTLKAFFSAPADLEKAAGAGGDIVTKSSKAPLEKKGVKTYSGFSKAPQKHDDIAATRYKQKLMQVKENKISDIRDMISEGTDNMNLQINGRTVTLNTSMAKRILEVYDSVNTKNKKIVESMLNEDLESFKKLLNFSIKV
jgi:hypothetical protein